MTPFLQLDNVKTHFPVEHGFIFKRRVGTVKAVDGVSLELAKGSGSGARIFRRNQTAPAALSASGAIQRARRRVGTFWNSSNTATKTIA